MSVQSEASKAAKKAAGEIWEGVLQSNSAIKAVDNFTGLGTFTAGLLDKKGFEGAAKAAGYLSEEGTANIAKIAGGYLGVSASARILTGGGLYRDKNGNANLIGVPFV